MDLRLQWVKPHVGTFNNKAADEAAEIGHRISKKSKIPTQTREVVQMATQLGYKFKIKICPLPDSESQP